MVCETSIYLGPTATVYQAELHAIEHAALWIAEELNQDFITIYSVSQASLKAISNLSVELASVRMTICLSLRYSCQTNRVNLAYVKAHVGHRGNERADLLAKRGMEGYGIDHSTSIPQPQNHFKDLVNINIIKMWQDCRQTKLWFPLIDKWRACGVMHTGRVDFSKCV